MRFPHVSRIRRHVSRFTFYALALLITLLTIAWSPAPQSGEIAVTGQVTNGTPDGPVPTALPVTLHVFSGIEETGTYTTTLTADGTFHFDEVAPEVGETFAARVVYQNVAYGSDLITLESEQADLHLPATIYENTDEPGYIQITQLHLFMSSAGDHIQVGEYQLIGNTGDRTYVGVEDPETGQRTTLSISVPDGASELQFDEAGLEERFLEQEDGFADTEPILPGDATAEVLLSYKLAYQEGLQVERTFDVPVASIVILLSGEGLALEGEGVVFGGAMDTQMGPALSYTAGPLEVGEPLVFRVVAGLPEIPSNQPDQARGAPVRNAAWETAAGLVALAGAAAAVYWMYRPPAPGPIPAQARPLVKKIAALDTGFEAGQMTEKAYRKKRRSLKQQVRTGLGKSKF